MRRNLALALAVIGVSVTPATAQINLVTGNGYKPYTDESLSEGGLATELVKAAYAAAGEDIRVKFMPWKRATHTVKNGSNLAAFPYLKNEKRSKSFVFSDPIIIPEVVPFTYGPKNKEISSYEAMKGKKLCLPAGYALSNSKIKDLVKSGQIQRVKPRNFTSCFRMLKRGRADFVNAEMPTGLATAKKVYGTTQEVATGDLILNKIKLRLMFSKDLENVSEHVATANKGLQKIRSSGRHADIVAKHLQ